MSSYRSPSKSPKSISRKSATISIGHSTAAERIRALSNALSQRTGIDRSDRFRLEILRNLRHLRAPVFRKANVPASHNTGRAPPRPVRRAGSARISSPRVSRPEKRDQCRALSQLNVGAEGISRDASDASVAIEAEGGCNRHHCPRRQPRTPIDCRGQSLQGSTPSPRTRRLPIHVDHGCRWPARRATRE